MFLKVIRNNDEMIIECRAVSTTRYDMTRIALCVDSDGRAPEHMAFDVDSEEDLNGIYIMGQGGKTVDTIWKR